MTRFEIADFDITDALMVHIAWRNITYDDLYAVLDRFWVVGRNRGNRAGSHLLIGTDAGGRCLAIPIVATDDPFIWRPITAWPCKTHERDRLRKGR